MKLYFALNRPQLKVFSVVCSNFVVVWLIAIVGAKDMFAVIRDIVSSIIAWYLAVKTEEVLEE